MKTPNATPVTLQSPKSRQLRNREVSSRFLPSPLSSTTTTEHGFSSSPRESHSPHQRKTGSTSTKNKSNSEEPSSITRHHQLWPSSSSSYSASSSLRNSGTLADRISEDRIREKLEHDAKINNTQKPTTKTSSKSSNSNNNGYKENDRPVIDGSTRFLVKHGYSPEPSLFSPSSSKRHNSIVPGRLSVDENALHRKSSRRNSSSSTNYIDSETDNCSDSSFRKTGVEVPSRLMNDVKTRRTRRGTSDSNIVVMNSSDSDSSLLKKLAVKASIKRANSLTGYKSSKSQWALSPGRTMSPSMSLSAKSMDTPLSFSSLKQTTDSPNKAKGVERFLSMGFDIFKSKKSLMNSSSSSPIAFGNSEAVHQLRLLDNRLKQWRFANARAQAVNKIISHQAKNNLMCAWDGITKLQQSVLKKKMQFGRQKLEMKLNFILYSQMKLIEAWGGLERQHLLTITKTKESLHSVVCRVPLLEGAEVDIPSTSIALQRASDLTASIKAMLTCLSPSQVHESAITLSELAKVVAQEKQLLEEFYDLFQIISVFEHHERSAKCNLIQLQSLQWKYQQQQFLHEITS